MGMNIVNRSFRVIHINKVVLLVSVVHFRVALISPERFIQVNLKCGNCVSTKKRMIFNVFLLLNNCHLYLF